MTTEQIIESINNLTELDFSEVLGAMAQHMERNKWSHLIDNHFQVDDKEDELNEAEETIMHLKKDKNRMLEAIKEAIDKLNAVS